MPTLIFAKEFLDGFAKLEPSVRQKVADLPKKFEDSVHTGVHLEKLTHAKDDRLRTVRVDQFWRGVVVRLGEARYVLLRVLPHDDAYSFAAKQRVAINSKTGIIEILDVPLVEERVNQVVAEDNPDEPSLFSERRDRDFSAVGIDEELIPILRRIRSESELYVIASYLPAAQADAVLLLADGKNTEQIWSELARDYHLTSETIDTRDIDTALRRDATKSEFAVTTTDAELVDLLTGDFEAWRVFLHPTQRMVAYRNTYSGPAKITGGAGTGKTIVAIHRARFLASQILQEDRTSERILFATYNKSLADNLENTLRTFCTPDEFRLIDVSTVDALARRTLSASKISIHPIYGEQLQKLAEEAATITRLDKFSLDGRFLISEWEDVVLARDLRSFADYATTPRPNRGGRLTRPMRIAVWQSIEYLLGELHRRKRATFLQIAISAANLFQRDAVRPYAHLVIDEAQDLHPAQWRLLREAVLPSENDMFIVGDSHQRIYEHKVSLRSIGIETRGNSRRLKINYRTSQQILSWAQSIFTNQEFDDLDGDADTNVGYRSALDGPKPTIKGFATPGEEANYVATKVAEWIREGVAPSAIAITARTRTQLSPVQKALKKANIEWSQVGEEHVAATVATSTMHAFKGLEFARVVVVAANRDVLPLPVATTPANEDELQHSVDVMRECCLLYVACTRARDELVVTYSGNPSTLLPMV